MAWVRIHDGALTHPKVGPLTHKAFRLWVWGLSYSQQHLTDGWLPAPSLPVPLRAAADELVQAQLWLARLTGYQVHDYLDWNDSKDTILAKRKRAGDRQAKWRETRTAAPAAPPTETRNNAGTETRYETRYERVATTVPTPLHSTKNKNPPTPHAAARGAPPLTRALRKRAEEVLRIRFGRCVHDPRCDNHAACLQVVAAELLDAVVGRPA